MPRYSGKNNIFDANPNRPYKMFYAWIIKTECSDLYTCVASFQQQNKTFKTKRSHFLRIGDNSDSTEPRRRKDADRGWSVNEHQGQASSGQSSTEGESSPGSDIQAGAAARVSARSPIGLWGALGHPPSHCGPRGHLSPKADRV